MADSLKVQYWTTQLDNCCGRIPKPPLPPFRESGITRWEKQREQDDIDELERLLKQ